MDSKHKRQSTAILDKQAKKGITEPIKLSSFNMCRSSTKGSFCSQKQSQFNSPNRWETLNFKNSDTVFFNSPEKTQEDLKKRYSNLSPLSRNTQASTLRNSSVKVENQFDRNFQKSKEGKSQYIGQLDNFLQDTLVQVDAHINHKNSIRDSNVRLLKEHKSMSEENDCL